MGRTNNNLRAARKAKNDEFYTLYEDVEAELSHYDFSGKIIYCNCDSETSSFCKYFTTNFKNLGIKHLYCTSFGGSFMNMMDPVLPEKLYRGTEAITPPSLLRSSEKVTSWSPTLLSVYSGTLSIPLRKKERSISY